MDAAKELVGLLQNGAQKVREGACATVLGFTGSDEGKHMLIEAGAHIRLTRLLGDEEAEPAVKALVNLTAENDAIGNELLKHRIIPKLMDSLKDSDCTYKRDAMMLLVNITQTDEGCEALLSTDGMGVVPKTAADDVLEKQAAEFNNTGAGAGGGQTQGNSSTTTTTFSSSSSSISLQGHHLRRIVQLLVSSGTGSSSTTSTSGANGGSGSGSSSRSDVYEYGAAVLANTTRIAAAREIILEPERRIFPAIFPQLLSSSSIRRQGIASTIRNCCFESEERHTQYFMSPSVELIANLLYPLAGPASEYEANGGVLDISLLPNKISSCDESKQREPVGAIRRALVESLLLLASTRQLRDHMRQMKVYSVIKHFHEWLESDSNPDRNQDQEGSLNTDDEATVESINKLVQQLYRLDEVPANQPIDPRHMKLVAPPVKATQPTVELSIAQALAKQVASNSNGMSQEEVESLVTPGIGSWDD